MMPNIVFAGPEAGGAPSAGIDPRGMEVMRHLDTGDEHEKLRERIRTLEESLKRLGRESLERAKLGMERLAEKYDAGALPPNGRVGPCEALDPHLAPSVEALGFYTAPGAMQTQQALAPASGFATS